ncbi:uncharacterized protein METZ01_LOCUS21955, partial [marine metagenome]
MKLLNQNPSENAHIDAPALECIGLAKHFNG